MRFLILLFLPILSFGQSYNETYTGRTRLGISIQWDNHLNRLYEWRATELSTRIRRVPGVSLEADQQLPGRFSAFSASLGLAYTVAKSNGNGLEIYQLATGVNYDFEESTKFQFLALSLGLRYTPFASRSVSPYLSGHLVSTYPLQIQYHYQGADPARPDQPHKVDITSKASNALGWKLQGGLQIRLSSRSDLDIGFQYLEVDHYTAWNRPSFSGEQDRTILQLNNFGYQFRWLFALN